MHNDITYKKIREVYEEKKHVFFEKPWDINIIGIRSNSMLVDEFNDAIGFIIKDDFGHISTMFFQASTKPGRYWLKEKMANLNGTFTLAEGQYRRCWQMGDHKGKYVALDQTPIASFKGWRDKDNDGQFDWSGELYRDVKGLELHTTSLINEVKKVGAYSAGCQITQNEAHHFIMMGYIEESMKRVGSKYVSYTLLNERDFVY